MHAMKLLSLPRIFAGSAKTTATLPSAATDSLAQVIPALAPKLTVATSIHPVAQAALSNWRSRPAAGYSSQKHEFTLLSTVGWMTAGVGTVAVGLVLGRELRRRYKFNRRTPYDFYAHSGDERELEFGVGV